MMATAVLSDRAQTDIVDLVRAIGRLSRPAAIRFADAVDARCRLIASNPGMGRPRDEIRPGVRSVVIEKKYLILFESIEEGVVILRIVDGRRDIDNTIIDEE